MKCSRCGNEVNPEEAFCGQCGAPMRQAAAPTEMVNTPAPRPGYPGAYQTTGRPNMPNAPSASFPSSSHVYQRGTPSGAPTGAVNMPYGGTQSPFPHPSTSMAPGPGQQSEFYQDATEAMSSLPPGSPSYPTAATGYPQGQQSFIGPGQPNGQNMYGTAAPAPFVTNRLNPQQSYGSEPGYNNPRSTVMPPRSQPNNTLLIVAIMCLVFVLISVVALGTFFLLKKHNGNTASGPNPNNGGTTTVQTPLPTATIAPSPTPSVTISPTPSPTITSTPTTPTPVASPTPAPDPGFSWCGAVCTNNNFTVEYPQSWQPGPATNAPGMQFTNPNAADIYASFKALGASQSTASTIAMNDLQTNYAQQPGYTVTQPGSTTTISGETWFNATATYQLNGQTERIIVYAIIHQGNAYIIELHAPDNQFDTINAQYFNVMLSKYQFLQ